MVQGLILHQISEKKKKDLHQISFFFGTILHVDKMLINIQVYWRHSHSLEISKSK